MRTLSQDELPHVCGGDGEENYNETACETAVGAVVAYSGMTYGSQATASGAALYSVSVDACQTLTTSVGDAIGSAAADVVIGFNQLVVDTELALGELQMFLNQGTMGL